MYVQYGLLYDGKYASFDLGIYGLSLNLQASKDVYYMYVFACERAWKIPVRARVRNITGNSGHI